MIRDSRDVFLLSYHLQFLEVIFIGEIKEGKVWKFARYVEGKLILSSVLAVKGSLVNSVLF